MIYVPKRPSPQAFEDWKKKRKPTRWKELSGKRSAAPLPDGGPDYSKAELRNYLHTEQRGICCYCNQAIEATARDTAIDHVQPKKGTQHQQLIFEYNNLSLSCKGGERDPKPWETYCDNSKEDQTLPLSHLNPACEEQIDHTLNGRMIGNTPAAVKTLNILNLNTAKLTNLREAAIAGFIYRGSSRTELIDVQEARDLLAALRVERAEEGQLRSFVLSIIRALETIAE